MSRICRRLVTLRLPTKRKTKKILEEDGIRHPKVQGRYLHILKVIGLLVDRGEFYSLTSAGRVLSVISETKELSLRERLLFFYLFFGSIPDQLVWMLDSIEKNEKSEDKSFERAVIYYFSLPQIQAIWKKATLIRSIREYDKSGKLARGIENKFETQCSWLRQMSLIRKTPTLRLTSAGRRVLEKLRELEALRPIDIKLLTATYYSKNFHFGASQESLETITRVAGDSLQKFSNEAGLCDLRSVELNLALTALSRFNTLIQEEDFRLILQKLKENGAVKSFILDRKGKPSFLQIS